MADLSASRVVKAAAGQPAKIDAARRHKWQPAQRYVLSGDDDDDIIRRGAKTAVIDHQVPARNVFRLGGEGREGNPTGRLLGEVSLRYVTLRDRLDIHAHGEEDTVRMGGKSLGPEQLASLLHGAGLASVGVLRIEACYVGKGDYLERLEKALYRKGIEVGYLAAYSGLYGHSRVVVTIFGGRHTVNFLAPLTVLVPFFWPIMSGKSVNGLPARLFHRVIKGTVDIRFPGTRYDLPWDGD